MATATPENLPDSGGSSAGDEERAMAREVRRMSDRELRDKAQRLQAVYFEGPVPPACRLPDRGEKLRLLLQHVLDEINRRRRVTATATPEKLRGGESRVGDEAGTAREVPDRVRQMSDRELREVAQRWKNLHSPPASVFLPDGGEKMRLLLQAVHDEISNRRLQHGSNGATRRAPDGDGRCSELHHVAQQRHGPVNEATTTTTALPERRQSSGEVNVGGKRAREAPRQSSDSEQTLWKRVQSLQELFAGPDGCRRLRLFLEIFFREVSNGERRHAHACTSNKAPMVVENASSGGAKRRRGFTNEAATGSPEEEPQQASGGEEARERVEAEVRHLSDQALWERAQRCQEALAASISARVPGGGVPRLCLDLGACLRELSDRHHQGAHPHGGGGEARAAM